jgi:hypothetical protein
MEHSARQRGPIAQLHSTIGLTMRRAAHVLNTMFDALARPLAQGE